MMGRSRGLNRDCGTLQYAIKTENIYALLAMLGTGDLYAPCSPLMGVFEISVP